MTHDHIGDLLDRLEDVTHPCDLDLLVFFARHPLTLMSSEQLATFLGYDMKQLAASLDALLGAGLVTRTPNVSHSARMYVFDGGADGGWLPALLREASTRSGRLALHRELRKRSANAPPRAEQDARSGFRRPVLVAPRQVVPGNSAARRKGRGGQ